MKIEQLRVNQDPLVETGGVGVGRAPVCIGVSTENDDGGAAGPTDFFSKLFRKAV